MHITMDGDVMPDIDGLLQERRNSALAMELRLSCTNSSIWKQVKCDTRSTCDREHCLFCLHLWFI